MKGGGKWRLPHSVPTTQANERARLRRARGGPGKSHAGFDPVGHPRQPVRLHQLLRPRRQRLPHRLAHLLPVVLVDWEARQRPPRRRVSRGDAPEAGAEGGVLPGQAVGEAPRGVGPRAEGGHQAPQRRHGGVIRGRLPGGKGWGLREGKATARTSEKGAHPTRWSGGHAPCIC
jgi:hypothetical protein